MAFSDKVAESAPSVQEVLEKDPWSFPHLSLEHRSNRELVITALRGQTSDDVSLFQDDLLNYVPPELLGDKEVILAALEANCWSLERATEDLRADPEVVLLSLKRQVAQPRFPGDSVLELAAPELLADEDFILAAAKVDLDSLAYASSELWRDKDFILQAMRVVPLDEQEFCYCTQVDKSVRTTYPLELVRGAANSVLAVQGENVPVLTVTLGSTATSSTTKGSSGPSIEHSQAGVPDSSASKASDPSVKHCQASAPDSSTKRSSGRSAEDSQAPATESATSESNGMRCGHCQVRLLSGTSFSCSWQDCAGEPADSPKDGEGSSPKSHKMNMKQDDQEERDNDEREPARKYPRLLKAEEAVEGTPSPMTVAKLAEMLLAELPKHVQIEPPPKRIFVVFTKPGSDDHSEEATPVTPWDWNRHVSEFC